MMWRNKFAGKKSMKLWLGGAFLLVVLSLVLASILNPSSKAISFEPYNWHQMGSKAHMSFRIKPEANAQSFRLDVWLPTGMGAPVQVSVQLREQKDQAASIELPMTFVSGGPDPYGFEGFDKYTYSAKELVFTEYGEWKLNLAITDAGKEVHQYEKEISLSK
jgi:hypothetical protein